jgi:hypothetical protein
MKMAEIGEPLKRRVLVPDDLPAEVPDPVKTKPTEKPAETEPATTRLAGAKAREKVPA